jgi:hypothetical protein
MKLLKISNFKKCWLPSKWLTLEIPDLGEIAEVDSFGQDSRTPQHDIVQRWCCLAPTQPFGRSREREKRERWRGWRTKEERRAWEARGNVMYFPFPPGDPLYIAERGAPCLLHKAPRVAARGWVARAKAAKGWGQIADPPNPNPSPAG